MSVLYVSHGHPAFAKGGGELAAWRLFEAFRNDPGFEGSGFLAAATSPDQLPAGSEVVGLSPDEWLIKRSTSAITHDTAVNLSCGGQLHQALAGRCFQIIHLHHYLHVGIDLVLALKRWFPKAKLLLTLHDYWGPCVYEGRLLRASGELCSGGDPEACDQCLGGGRRGELAVRQVRLQRLISIIDHFICPSYFLKSQYLRWGVSSDRLSVIENLPAKKLLDAQKQRSQKELVIGYFGQLNRWKGVDLLVEAVHVARNQGIDLILEINGPSADIQLLKSDGIFWNGRYEPEQLWERMARVDVVAMSSIWFENSPMVIQVEVGGHVEETTRSVPYWLTPRTCCPVQCQWTIVGRFFSGLISVLSLGRKQKPVIWTSLRFCFLHVVPRPRARFASDSRDQR